MKHELHGFTIDDDPPTLRDLIKPEVLVRLGVENMETKQDTKLVA